MCPAEPQTAALTVSLPGFMTRFIHVGYTLADMFFGFRPGCVHRVLHIAKAFL